MEFNPLWSVEKFLNMQLPADWTIVQHIVTVDASCFQVYMNNLKSLFVEMVRKADMVIFNRCRKELPLASFRRSVKVVNPAAEIIFENENHEVEDILRTVCRIIWRMISWISWRRITVSGMWI